MKPTKKIPKQTLLNLNPSQRKHIPALTPEALTRALQQLQTLPLDSGAKQVIGAMLTTASHPHSETPEAIIPTLPVERQANIRMIGKLIAKLQSDVTKRGNVGLAQIPEDEWQRLVDEANE